MLDIVNTTELNTENATNTTAVTSYYGTAGDTAGNIKYDPFAPKQVAAQHALDDVQTIKPRTRDEYVGLFKRTEERTARTTLQMCRVVYEAQQSLEEHHEHYPCLWQSECGTYRIIRCCDDIQYIFQRWRNPKWRSLSYHVEYFSLVRRWANEAALPRGLSSVLNSTHAEPNNTNLLDPHSRCIV